MKKLNRDVLIAAAGMLLFSGFGVIIGWNMQMIKYVNMKPHQETNYNPSEPSVAERKPIPVYRREILREFKPGDTLSSKENGAYILWKEWMGRELIVGVVTDSGTINTDVR
jgi:hypothetical protein